MTVKIPHFVFICFPLVKNNADHHFGKMEPEAIRYHCTPIEMDKTVNKKLKIQSFGENAEKQKCHTLLVRM